MTRQSYGRFERTGGATQSSNTAPGPSDRRRSRRPFTTRPVDRRAAKKSHDNGRELALEPAGATGRPVWLRFCANGSHRATGKSVSLKTLGPERDSEDDPAGEPAGPSHRDLRSSTVEAASAGRSSIHRQPASHQIADRSLCAPLSGQSRASRRPIMASPASRRGRGTRRCACRCRKSRTERACWPKKSE